MGWPGSTATSGRSGFTVDSIGVAPGEGESAGRALAGPPQPPTTSIRAVDARTTTILTHPTIPTTMHAAYLLAQGRNVMKTTPPPNHSKTRHPMSRLANILGAIAISLNDRLVGTAGFATSDLPREHGTPRSPAAARRSHPSCP